ncbi:MAG: radical SAM protein [Desulfobacterales bacterium]|nr:radical SAM protein [Desulfobacterales bacterium]
MKHVIRYLILWLTTGCNLDCLYCYREKEDFVRSLTLEDAQKALRMAAISGKSFHVQLAGGEPTLESALIEAIATTIRRNNWPATIALQTNGTLIDEKLISLCQKYNIQIGVSLDGTPDIQERLRGSARQTFLGLKQLEASNVDFRVTTVVTDVNVEHLWRLALLLSGFRSARGMGLDLLVNKGRAVRHNLIKSPSVDSLRAGLKKLLDTIGSINKRRTPPLQLREFENLYKQSDKTGKRAYCHACQGESLAVHPDGAIYPCGQTIGDPDFVSGTLDLPDWPRLKTLSSYSLEGLNCSACPIEQHCPGDCPSRQHYNNKKDRLLSCAMYQTLWQYKSPRESLAYNGGDTIS